jgi:hypothetical protein
MLTAPRRAAIAGLAGLCCVALCVGVAAAAPQKQKKRTLTFGLDLGMRWRPESEYHRALEGYFFSDNLDRLALDARLDASASLRDWLTVGGEATYLHDKVNLSFPRGQTGFADHLSLDGLELGAHARGLLRSRHFFGGLELSTGTQLVFATLRGEVDTSVLYYFRPAAVVGYRPGISSPYAPFYVEMRVGYTVCAPQDAQTPAFDGLTTQLGVRIFYPK